MVNIDVVKDIISDNGYTTFAVCEYGHFGNKHTYFIAPIIFKDDKIIRCSAVFDNLNKYGEIIMTKEEMIMKFILTFGYSVDYYLNEDTWEFSTNV
jgi:hypothetical protein